MNQTITEMLNLSMAGHKIVEFKWYLIADIEICYGFGFVWNKNTLKERISYEMMILNINRLTSWFEKAFEQSTTARCLNLSAGSQFKFSSSSSIGYISCLWGSSSFSSGYWSWVLIPVMKKPLPSSSTFLTS
jgi:hypothetical protein